MALQAVQLITTGVNYAFELFTTMLDRTGLTNFYFAMLAILLIISFLLGGFLVPVVGSDMVDLQNRKKSGVWSRKSKYDTRSGRSTANTGLTGSNSGNTKGIGKF